jgi:trimeric autotransporter adhesin
MKRIALLFATSILAFGTQAQTSITLTGTSYTQNFDGLGVALPTGWSVWTGATATSLGTVRTMTTQAGLPFQISPDTSACAGLILGGGFKNYPSADVINPGVNFCVSGTTTLSATYSDRALGVRQIRYDNTSFPASDSGAAFALQLANTTGISNMNVSFKLQSLDTASSRTTTWKLDYGIGATPSSFTAITTTGTMTTGGKTFSNNTITATLPAAVDNQSSPVWIRIAAINATTGSGTRASTAIDDFTLTYSNTTGVNDIASFSGLLFNVVGEATSSKVTFAYNTQSSGNYTLSIYDLSGRIISTQKVNVTAGYTQLTVSDLNLSAGLYIAKMGNEAHSAVAKIMIN